MTTFGEHLAEATRRLAPVTETPRLDAEILLAHALGLTRAALLARLRESHNVPSAFEIMLERRVAHEPIAYILGEWEFFSLGFYVPAPLLVPRPETEHLVEVVLETVGTAPACVLDVGTGTGCVGVAIAANAPRARVTATDINPDALATAARNAARHGVAERIEFHLGDLFDALPSGTELFDVVCSNPPYVEDTAWAELPAVIRLYEDPGALLGGLDGLDVVRRLVEEARGHLRPGGLLAFEIGMGQYSNVHHMLEASGYEGVGFRRDLGGIERIAFARVPEGR